MEMDCTKPNLCHTVNLNESITKQPNLAMVKKEEPGTDDIPSSSPDTKPEVGVNWPLELKSEIFARDCYEKIHMKKELVHEELDIKSEDATIQKPHIDDYNLGNHVYFTSSSGRKYALLRTQTFKCNSCDFENNRKGDLQTHLCTRYKDKPFKCTVCHCSYRQKHHLQNHFMTHTGVMPFKCNICYFSCLTWNQLQNHFMTHSEAKPFKCHICDYSCQQRSQFQNHLKNHTGERPFKYGVFVKRTS